MGRAITGRRSRVSASYVQRHRHRFKSDGFLIGLRARQDDAGSALYEQIKLGPATIPTATTCVKYGDDLGHSWRAPERPVHPACATI